MPAADGNLVFNTKIDTGGMERDAKGMSSKVLGLRNKVSSTAAAVRNLREELEKTGSTKVKPKAAESIERDIAKAQARLNELDAQADVIIGNTREKFGIAPDDDKTLGYFLNQNKEWQKLQTQIEATEEKLSGYQQRLKQVNAATPLTRDTAAYKQQEQRLTELSGTLTVYQARLREAEQAEAQKTARIADASRKTVNYKQYLHQTVRALKMLHNGLKKAYSGLKKTFSNTVGKGIKNIGTHFKSAGRQTNMFEKSLRRVKNILTRMFFMRLVHGPIDAVKDGLSEIAKVSPEVNRDLSDLKTSGNYLKNSFAALAAPLLHLVTPAFVHFMDVTAAVSDSVARLIAMLSGQDTYTKAVKIQQDYAASLDDSTDSVKDNTKAVQENQKNLAGYDQLNVMNDDSSADNATTQAAQPAFSVAEAQVAGVESTLLSALKNQDWNAVGELIGDKVNTALSKFKWKKIKKTAGQWAANIAALFNGFLKETDWSKVGETAAEGVNTVISFVLGYAYTFDWRRFGRSLRTSLVSFFSNLDKDEMIVAFDAVINGIVQSGIELVGNPEEWKQWGADLEQNMSDAIKGINWKNVKTLFHNLLKGVFNFGDGFFGGLFDDVEKELDGKDFNELGHNAAKAIKSSNWEEVFGKDSTIGKGLRVLSETVVAGLDWVIGFLEEPGTADSISEGFSTLLGNVDWAQLLIKALTALFDAVAWITDAATNLINDFCDSLSDGFADMESNPELMCMLCKLGAAFSNMLISGLELGLNLLFSALPNVILGLIKLLAGYVAQAGHWVYEKLFGKEFADKWYASALIGLAQFQDFKIPQIKLPRAETTLINGRYTNIPKYATGTVVPANYGEFLAVLGDNRREPEVVSPVSAMKQAFLEALAEVGYSGGDRPVYVTVVMPDGSVLLRTVGEADDDFYSTHGFSRFDRRQRHGI